MNRQHLTLAIATFFAGMSAQAQEVTPTQLPKDHPLVGTWRIELPEQKCFEEYDVRADGTKLSRSAEERNESIHSISVVPSPNGFYKWVDKIVKNNGKPDCSGSVGSSGHVAINFIRLHPSGQRMLLCEAEDMKTCYAEFRRKE
jgi:hypothetical protein